MKNCLEGGPGAPQAAKYLVYRLPAESSLIGIECMLYHPLCAMVKHPFLGVICLEEFAKGGRNVCAAIP